MFQGEKQGNGTGCPAATSPYFFSPSLSLTTDPYTHTDIPSTERAVELCVCTRMLIWKNPFVVVLEWQSDSVVEKTTVFTYLQIFEVRHMLVLYFEYHSHPSANCHHLLQY